MRSPWFAQDVRGERLQAVAQSWLDTPHRWNQAVKGPCGGVDCARLILCILEETGAISPVDRALLPVLEWDYATRDRPPVIEPFIEYHLAPLYPHEVVTSAEDLLTGDIVTVALRVHRPRFHFALCLGSRLVHCPLGGRVSTLHRLHPSLPRLFLRAFRLMEEV